MKDDLFSCKTSKMQLMMLVSLAWPENSGAPTDTPLLALCLVSSGAILSALPGAPFPALSSAILTSFPGARPPSLLSARPPALLGAHLPALLGMCPPALPGACLPSLSSACLPSLLAHASRPPLMSPGSLAQLYASWAWIGLAQGLT